MTNRFLLNKRDGKLMGVAAGMADMTGSDPLIIRLAIILALLVTGPVAAILYVAAGALAPSGE
jgi:phage shock protein C